MGTHVNFEITPTIELALTVGGELAHIEFVIRIAMFAHICTTFAHKITVCTSKAAFFVEDTHMLV